MDRALDQVLGVRLDHKLSVVGSPLRICCQHMHELDAQAMQSHPVISHKCTIEYNVARIAMLKGSSCTDSRYLFDMYMHKLGVYVATFLYGLLKDMNTKLRRKNKERKSTFGKLPDDIRVQSRMMKRTK